MGFDRTQCDTRRPRDEPAKSAAAGRKEACGKKAMREAEAAKEKGTNMTEPRARPSTPDAPSGSNVESIEEPTHRRQPIPAENNVHVTREPHRFGLSDPFGLLGLSDLIGSRVVSRRLPRARALRPRSRGASRRGAPCGARTRCGLLYAVRERPSPRRARDRPRAAVRRSHETRRRTLFRDEDPRFLRELAHAFCAEEGSPARRFATDIDETLINVLLEGLPLTSKTRFFAPFMEGGRLVRHLCARTPVRRIVGWDVNPYRVLLLQAEHLRTTRGRATAPAPRYAERNLLAKRPSTVLLLLALAGGIDAGAAVSPEGSLAAAAADVPAAYREYDLSLITLCLAGRALEPGGRFALLTSKEAARNEANAKLRRELFKFGSVVGITGLGNDDGRLVLLFERSAAADQTYCVLKEGDACEIAEASRFLEDPQTRFEIL